MTSSGSPDFLAVPSRPLPKLSAIQASTSAPAASALLDPLDEVRQLAQSDLYTFARLIAPERVFGEIHREVFNFLQDNDLPQLLLLPRAHMKSFCIAVWCVWHITNHPDTTIIYVSATSTLAEEQLYAIKRMLDSPTYRRYWPSMTHPEEGKRSRWSATAITVDHPARSVTVRDPTVRATGLSGTTTGLHCDVLIADDVVVPENAYTAESRRKTAAAMSQFASILNPGGVTKACGTRYHSQDQYHIWKEQVSPTFDPVTQEHIDDSPIWDIKEHPVEQDGIFLWPRTARASDGKMFGFDKQQLAIISAKYTDRKQFYAQYYNDPNDPESAPMTTDRFQYYDHAYLSNRQGRWYFKDDPLSLYAGIDFAYTTNKTSDYTAIAVIGVAPSHDIYILDLVRFKTSKISKYYDQILRLQSKWEFTRLRAEVTAAQSVIVDDLKQRIGKDGGRIKIDAHNPSRHLGAKEERIAATLEPKYDNLQIWHYKGGYIPMLEEELIMARPPHDDLKDVLAFTIEHAKAPRERFTARPEQLDPSLFHSRFGGVAFR